MREGSVSAFSGLHVCPLCISLSLFHAAWEQHSSGHTFHCRNPTQGYTDEEEEVEKDKASAAEKLKIEPKTDAEGKVRQDKREGCAARLTRQEDV